MGAVAKRGCKEMGQKESIYAIKIESKHGDWGRSSKGNESR
jgi:hypothetical protein